MLIWNEDDLGKATKKSRKIYDSEDVDMSIDEEDLAKEAEELPDEFTSISHINGLFD